MKRLLILPIVSFIGAAAFCTGMFSSADETVPAPDAPVIDNTPVSSDLQVDQFLQNIITEAPVITPAPTAPVTEPMNTTSDTIRFTTPLRQTENVVDPEIEETEPVVTTTVTTPEATTTPKPVTTTKPVTTPKPVTTTKPTTTTKAPETTKAPAANDPTTGVLSAVEKIIKIAKAEIGVKEKAYNNVKYNTWYYGKPVSTSNNSSSQYAWCAVFISWCADQAGIPESVIPKTAGASTYYNWFKSRGLFYKYNKTTPKPGDVIFIDWEKGHGGVDHVGIVVSVENGIVTTVEGNYSNKVSCNTYSLNSGYIVGYGRPNYK